MSNTNNQNSYLMKKFLIEPGTSIREALRVMGVAGEKCLIVVDPGERVIGTLSDGDIRRAILKGYDLDVSIKEFYNKAPTVLERGGYSQKQVRVLFSENRFESIPIVDRSGKIVDVLTWDTILEKDRSVVRKKLEMAVVIMAGGRGTRLEPFTKVLPKPLLPINDKPIIEHIIEKFTAVGINKFYLTVNYMSRILKAYFEELQPSYTINLIEEPEPLGTAGSIKYLEGQLDKPFIVTNCDVIIDTDYADLVSFHEEKENALTLVACEKKIVIPYGTCRLNKEGSLDRIEEKPEYRFLVNTGLYILSPELLKLIPKEKFYHMTQLIDDAKQAGLRVGVYPVGEESWADVGQWPEYQKAIEMFTK